MLMPEHRSGERSYLMWDPLQLREGIKGPYAVASNSVSYDLFRVFRGKLSWRPALYGSVFISAKPEQNLALHVLNTLCKQTRLRGYSEYVDIDFYEFCDSSWKSIHTENALQLDDSHSFMRYHPFADSLECFIDAALAHRRKIRELTKQSGLVEPWDKKVQIMVVQLTTVEVQQLAANATLQLKLQSLASSSSVERMHFIFVCDDMDSFPPKVVLSFGLQIFIGAREQRMCMDVLHPDVVCGAESFYQLRIGVVFDSFEGKLTPIHWLKYTPSAWNVAKAKQQETAEENYRKILEGLPDGS